MAANLSSTLFNEDDFNLFIFKKQTNIYLIICTNIIKTATQTSFTL